MQLLKVTPIVVSTLLITACGFDPASSEYDEMRYHELQKASCEEMSAMGASKLISREGKNKDEIFERCKKMKALTLEQYKYAATQARQNGGDWDLDNIPNK